MKPRSTFALALASSLVTPVIAQPPPDPYPRPLRELRTDYFPLHFDGENTAETWVQRRLEIRERVLLASGLFPLPTKTPLPGSRIVGWMLVETIRVCRAAAGCRLPAGRKADRKFVEWLRYDLWPRGERVGKPTQCHYRSA